jgi:hypothetical protein
MSNVAESFVDDLQDWHSANSANLAGYALTSSAPHCGMATTQSFHMLSARVLGTK